MSLLVHGGPDAGPPVRYDFSTNANALGPLPTVMAAVAQAPRVRYPEPSYGALRQQLGTWHNSTTGRIVPAASAGEFIWRLTQWHGQRMPGARAWLPQAAYSEYAAAARAYGLPVFTYAGTEPPAFMAGDLCWVTEPHSPSGTSLLDTLPRWLTAADQAGARLVLDLAYQPLRLDGRHAALRDAAACSAWQLWSPNKACGLTGVRGAYAVAPAGAETDATALRAHAPSWVLGAEGQVMVSAFCTAPAQAELAAHRAQLIPLRDALQAALTQRGWRWLDSTTPFARVHPPGADALAPLWHAAMRQAGIKLRDAASFGQPGWMRISVQAIDAQQSLCEAWDRLGWRV